MKYKWIYIMFFTFFVIFICCSKSIDKESQLYNGIDSQILNIVDSIDGRFREIPFITIWFSSCNDGNSNVVRVFNSILIPTPDSLDYSKKSLISENKGFIGYKKYHNVYLVFLEYDSNNMLDKFVKRDSLSFNEDPFIHYNVYEFDNKTEDCKFVEKKYLITERDGLIFYNGKCTFDID